MTKKQKEDMDNRRKAVEWAAKDGMDFSRADHRTLNIVYRVYSFIRQRIAEREHQKAVLARLIISYSEVERGTGVSHATISRNEYVRKVICQYADGRQKEETVSRSAYEALLAENERLKAWQKESAVMQAEHHKLQRDYNTLLKTNQILKEEIDKRSTQLVGSEEALKSLAASMGGTHS